MASASSKGHENYYSLMNLVQDKGLEALKNTLEHLSTQKYKVATFQDVLKIHLVKAELKEKHIIPGHQWNILYPSSGATATPESLDITLCFVLIRHLTDLKEPRTTWNKPPAVTDNSLEGAIAQIRYIRNILAHSTNYLSEAEYNKYHNDIEKALQDISNHLPSWNITQADIKKFKTMQVSQKLTDLKGAMEEIQTAIRIIREIADEKDYGKRLQHKMKHLYAQEMRYIRCNPLDPDVVSLIDDSSHLYIVEEEEDSMLPKGKKVLSTYWDTFMDQSEWKKPPYKICIKGKPGVGKTTFTKRIAVDWAECKEKILSERFENVFVLTLRKVEVGQTLVDVISEQLLPYKSPLVQNLESYLISKQIKCLFVLDGLDELKPKASRDIDQMLQGNYLAKASLVVTVNLLEVQSISLPSKMYKMFRIEGLSEQEMHSYIGAVFGRRSIGLFNEIKAKGLIDIAKIPLILNILCMLYTEQRSLPENITKVYQTLQQMLHKHKKDEETESDDEEETILLKLGKVAFENLIEENNQIFFTGEKIKEEVGDGAFSLGLLGREQNKHCLDANVQVSFLHKSLQEYAAAVYISRETDCKNYEPWEKLKQKLKTTQMIVDHDLLLQFCTGLSETLASKILTFLDEKIKNMDGEWELFSESLDSLTIQKDLTGDQIQSLCNYSISDDVLMVLELQAKCLSNLERPTGISPHIVHQICCSSQHSGTDLIKEAYEKGIIKPEKCIASISDNRDLENFIQTTDTVLWIKLEGGFDTPFAFTVETIILLKKMFYKNQHGISVCLGENCQADSTTMFSMMKLLNEHPKVKYKYIKLGTGLPFHRNMYGMLDWEMVFQILSGIRYLVALKLNDCDLPTTVLRNIGTILKENARTLIELDLRGNSNLESNLDLLAGETGENMKSLRVLKIQGLAEADTYALKRLMKKCRDIRQLDISDCACEISRDILSLENLTELDITGTAYEPSILRVFLRNWIGLWALNVGQVIHDIDTLAKLKVLIAQRCGIDDAMIQRLPLNKPLKLRKIDLGYNKIGTGGIIHLFQSYKNLETLEQIGLRGNYICDEGGQVVIDHIQQFKKLGSIGLGNNRISEHMKQKIKDKCQQCGIICSV